MAELREGYTLCGLLKDRNAPDSGIQGIEPGSDGDHVVVTNSTRSVIMYKVSDQKPLCSWTVKQGQTLTCCAVYNPETKEYVGVSDHKVIRVWKAEDLMLDKAFKATVSSDVWRVHCARGGQPVVLFQRGALRCLDSLLAAPQQQIEEVLGEEETIRWSADLVAETQHFVVFTTEQKGSHFLYVHRLNPQTLHKYRLESEEPGLPPLSVSASYREKHISLLYLYPNGHVYQSQVSVRAAAGEDGAQALPRVLLLRLPVGEGSLGAAMATVLDEAHMVVVGVPHPSAGVGKDFLCIWNTNFQTLQAAKEIAGKIYGQLWSYSGKLFIPHGRSLSVIPYECPESSLASALGKRKQAGAEECKVPTCALSWNTLLHERAAPNSDPEEHKETKENRSQFASDGTVDRVLELIKTGSVMEVEREVQGLLSRPDAGDVQPAAGHVASSLVARSSADPAFYPHTALAALVSTKCLCHSLCPDLLMLALEKKDYFLCQLCLNFFPDIPEAVTCACLKTFISVPDADVKQTELDPGSIAFMELLVAGGPDQDALHNGFSHTPPTVEDGLEQRGGEGDAGKGRVDDQETTSSRSEHTCPVGLHKAVLLNEILQTPYNDAFLLPHLKDLTPQQVILFLQYLLFLYFKYSKDAFALENCDSRTPTLTQIVDWVCLLLDGHFTVLVMTPEARDLLLNLHKFVRCQVKMYSELGKIEGSLQELHNMKAKQDIGQYSIQVIKLF